MSLFDIFSGDQGVSYAKKADARGNLLAGQSQSAVTDLAKQEADARNAALAAGQTAARGDINTGTNQALGYEGQGLAPWQQLYGQEQQGYGTYMDALGLNGPEGTTRARSSFTASPGYDYTLNQGLTALDRNAAAEGRLNSGNTDTDTLAFAHNLSDQDYQHWLDRLSGFNPAVGAQGETGQYNEMASTAANQGAQLGTLDYGTGQLRSGVAANQFATDIGAKQNYYTNVAQNDAAMYGNEYAAQQAANQNQWGALMQGLKLAGTVAGAAAGAAAGAG